MRTRRREQRERAHEKCGNASSSVTLRCRQVCDSMLSGSVLRGRAALRQANAPVVACEHARPEPGNHRRVMTTYRRKKRARMAGWMCDMGVPTGTVEKLLFLAFCLWLLRAGG